MVGCAARILKVIKLAKDNFCVILQGVSRFACSSSTAGAVHLARGAPRARSDGDATSSSTRS